MNYKFLNKFLYPSILVILIFIMNMPYLQLDTFSNTDEFTSLAVPAFLAGYDWSPASSLSGFHGYGFTAWLFPVFKLLKNPAIIYKCALILCMVVKMGCGLLTFKICRYELNLDNKNSFLIGLSYIIGSLGPDDTCGLSVMSEIPFTFLNLLIIVCMLKSYHSKDKIKSSYSFLVGLLLAYCYTLHSRCIILYFSFTVIYLLYKLLYKRTLVNIKWTVFGYIVTMIVCIVFFSYIKSNVYSVENMTSLSNDPFTVAKSSSYLIARLFNMELLKQCALTFSSLLVTLFLISGGFLLICIIGAGASLKNFKLQDNCTENLFMLAAWGLCTLVFMNGAIALTSSRHVLSGDLKWLTYIRYCKPFLAPLFIVGGFYTLTYISNKLRSIVFILAGSAIVQIFIGYYWRQIFGEKYGLKYSILNRIFFNAGKISAPDYLVLFGTAAFDITLLTIIVMRKVKYKQIVLIFFMIVSIIIGNQHMKFYLTKNPTLVEVANLSINAASMLEEQGISFFGDASRVKYVLYFQFGLYEKKLDVINIKTHEINEEVADRYAVFSDKKYKLENIVTKYRYELEEGEYLYFSQKKDLEWFREHYVKETVRNSYSNEGINSK